MRNRWIRNEVGGVINNHIVDYPTPANLSYAYGFGSLAGLCLVIQIITGVFLGMHYAGNVEIAFNSVEHIMRDVNNGWLIRYMHSNGASMFFIIVYIHMFRGLYYGSYMAPRRNLWISGIVIFLLMIITAFIGYVLPYGQMSLYGAVVITNLVTAVPYIGKELLVGILGGYSVDNATLNRFYSLHYMLPFIIAGMSLVHLVLLHIDGSGNRIGVDSKVDKIGFYPYCYVKDLLVFLVMLIILSYLVYYNPNVLSHSDNYVMANKLVTPAHIVPEWYFLPFYAILRSVPHKLGGVVMMVMAIVSIGLLPFISMSEVRSNAFKPLNKRIFWLFVVVCLILGIIGQKPVESPYVEVGQILSQMYFLILLVIIPMIGRLENKLMRL